MKLKIGDVAPDFTLKDTEGNDVTLSSFEGETILLLFFPLAFTGVCTKELCTVRDNITFYNDFGVTVLGISVDSFFTLSQFKSMHNLNYTLLSDFNKEVSEAYDALYNNFFGMNGVSKRSAFVIDRQQRIRYIEILEKASDIPDFSAISEVLRQLKQN